MKAGKHVFIEKPVATDAPGVRRLLAANEEAKHKGLKVGVGLQRHHDAVYVDLVAAAARRRDRRHHVLPLLLGHGQPAKQPVAHAGLTELEYQVRNWYFFAWLCGDHIVEQHIHNLDVCNWVQERPARFGPGASAAGKFAPARNTAISSTITPSNTPMPMGRRCSANAGRFPAA